jgi:transposase
MSTDKEAPMHNAGIDLHRQTLVVATEDEHGVRTRPRTFSCARVDQVREYFESLVPFHAVIEASSSYRWLYDLLSPMGEVILAHPRRLRAIVEGRAKTDKIDAALLARLLRADLILRSYVPPHNYAALRAITRARSRLVRRRVEACNEMHAMLGRLNLHVPFKTPFGKRWKQYVSAAEFAEVDSLVRDEIFRRIGHYDSELRLIDTALADIAKVFPEVSALVDIRGIGVYTALLIVAEIGEPWRFRDGRQVGAYAGLTARVNQSGGHCYHGRITRQGSPWLRWALVQVAIKVVRDDRELNNFYERIRKRSSAKIARVAVARKLAGICWLRLMRYHAAQAA